MVLTLCNERYFFLKGGFVPLFKELFSCRRISLQGGTFFTIAAG